MSSSRPTIAIDSEARNKQNILRLSEKGSLCPFVYISGIRRPPSKKRTATPSVTWLVRVQWRHQRQICEE